MRGRILSTSIFIFLMIFSTFSPLYVQAESTPSSPTITVDESGQLPQFTDSRVRYASDWASIFPVRWVDLNGTEYAIGTGNIINVPGAPTARVKASPLRLVDEQYLGTYTSIDGRDVIVKEYTLDFDVCVWTIEDWQTYFGKVKADSSTHELYRLDVYYYPLLWGAFTGWQLDEGRRVSANITFHGYDLTLERFQQYGDKILQGNLLWQVAINTGLWSDVFDGRGVYVMQDGNWTYTDQVYSSVRDITCINKTYGMLESNERPTIISDTAANLDGKGEQTDPVDGPKFNDIESLGETAGYTVRGYYDPTQSGPVAPYPMEYGEEIESDAIGDPAATYYGPELERAVYWGARGFDPDSPPADTVFFTTYEGLAPRRSLWEYKFVYHYESEAIEDWVITWKVHTALKTDTCWDVKTVAWQLLNFYTYNTYRMKVVIGGYYDWQPMESAQTDHLRPPDRRNGNNTFPIIRTGTQQGSAFMPDTMGWIIMLMVAVIIAVVVIYVIKKLRGGGKSKAEIHQTIQFGIPPTQQQLTGSNPQLEVKK